jgi:C-terminal processing protease CtpA/Prc
MDNDGKNDLNREINRYNDVPNRVEPNRVEPNRAALNEIKAAAFKRTIILVSVLMVVFFVFGGTKLFRTNSEAKKDYQYLSLFSEVVSLVKSDYVEKVEPEKKFPGAFSGMLEALDRFSAYLDKRQTFIYDLYRQSKAYTLGIYGAEISGYFYITDVLKNSPAEKAGISPGCIIRGVNGKSIYGKSFWQMYLSLLSDKKETVELILLKEKEEKPVQVKLETSPQEKFDFFIGDGMIHNIKDDIYIVNLSRFDEEHVTVLERRLKKLSDGGKQLKLILDLRKYKGGNLNSFLRLTRLFFDQSVKMTLKTKNKKETIILGSPSPLSYRAVAVINGSTMMYGELLAYLFKNPTPENVKDSIHDKKADNNQKKRSQADTIHSSHANVTVFGGRTVGFISKLKHIPLSDGSSILLTEGLFLINDKNPVKSGVKPDIALKEKAFDDVIARSISILEKTNDS